jgi:CMP-N-acetylneuraminic acid synthetase
VLETVVENVQNSKVVDDIAIVTDDEELISRGNYSGVGVRACPDNMRSYTFNSLGIETYRICMERDFLNAVGLKGNVSVIAPWTLPLVSPRTIERLYHVLLEDPLAGRAVPIVKVDPQLYMRCPDQDAFFPVWVHKGMDRQRIPQLYRCRPFYVAHMDRLTRSLPKIAGLQVPKAELTTISKPDDLELATFLMGRKW